MYLTLERYSRPTSAEEALRLLGEEGHAALIAGGTELNMRGHEAIEHLVDLQSLPMKELRIFGDPPSLELGALVTMTQLRRHELTGGDLLTALRQAAAGYANLALQNRSTLGGRVMLDRGDQDLPSALLALGAKLHVAKLRDGLGVTIERMDYPTGDRSALDGALLVGVELPLGEGVSAHRRFGRSAVDAPLACASACKRGDDVRVAANVLADGAAGLTRLSGLEALLAGWNGSRPADWRDKAREACLAELPSYACNWVSARYRADITATLAVRAVSAVLGEEEVA